MTFEFDFNHSHVTMDLGALVLLVFLAVVYLWFTYWLLNRGIRSLRGKALNNPPSPIFWAKVTADVLDTKMDEIWHGVPEAFQVSRDAHKYTTAAVQDGHMQRVQSCKVSYEYKGQSYTSIIWSPVVCGGKTEIYCNKRKPERTKVYTSEQSPSKSAGISLLLLGGFLVLLGFVVICGIFS